MADFDKRQDVIRAEQKNIYVNFYKRKPGQFY